ncbi:MAG: FtsB family cell division protein [Coriobacteriia bacterium]
MVPLACAGLVIFAAWSFYPVARVQYGEQRQKARLEAELQSLKERNSNLRREVDHLKTPEGVEQVARESLGLVKEGENVYVVLDGDETGTAPVLDPDTASAAVPPESAWLKVLDAIFGFK